MRLSQAFIRRNMSSNMPPAAQLISVSPVSDSGRSVALDGSETDVNPMSVAHAQLHSGVCEVGSHRTPSFMARVETPHSESGVSIGPLIAGISMMVLMRRHRF